jgi:shikimate dehydrogenase
MRLYLLGRGIQHSLSPAMWNGVFGTLGLESRYGLLDVDEDSLPAALDRLHEPDVLAFNVTMPYKGWAYEHAAVRSPDVARSRGCNLIRVRDGAVAAENTDVAGARMLLDAIPECDEVLLLGAGGTARAMLTALAGRAGRVVVSNRTRQHADEVAGRASRWLDAVTCVPWADRMAVAARADLIINTTPLGMRDDRSPLDDPPWQPRDTARIYDVVYRAEPTPLQRQAARWGLPLADGLAHLEAQAVALLPHFGLHSTDAHLVRASLSAAVGHEACRWRTPSTGGE